ncbi:MAG: B12-binding domain-containing radical SAM protein, partial [Selenomonadales bacterium]|nr:B12-binding domain-containing radical SAM protein [Selenomonadales bacterium]
MDIIGFAISFEMDYFNFLRCLQLGKIPLKAEERTIMDPIIIVGGPCATFNPEPLTPFVDVFVIGEGENTVQRILDVYEAEREKYSREDILAALAQIDGVYVPRFYQPSYHEDGTIAEMTSAENVPNVITRQWVTDLNDTHGETVVMTPDTEFGKLYLIEIARGCGRHCRFCMAGYCFRNPRVRSLDAVKASVLRAKPYMNKVGLMGAAISDYPWIDELSAFIREQDMTMSV